MLWSWHGTERSWAGTTHSFDETGREIVAISTAQDVTCGIFSLIYPMEDNSVGKINLLNACLH